jgi:photosystem II stability/assembly factor-like uncharacterized protein
MKTTNAGQSWDLLDIYATFGTQAPSDLNDIDFYATAGGSFVVTIIGDGGFVAKSTDLTNFTLINSGINANDNLISIDHDGSKQIIVGQSLTNNTIYSKLTSANTWSVYTSNAGLEILTLDSLSAKNIIAGAIDGRIYVNDWSNATNAWYPILNNLTQDVTELQFFNELQGFAISGGKLYKTENGGSNWNLFSNETYLDLAKSKDRSMIGAVAQNGVIRILFPNTTSSTTSHIVPFTGATNIKTIWVNRNGSNSNTTWSVVVSNGASMYYCWNAMSPFPVFTPFATGQTASVVDFQFNTVSNTSFDGVTLLNNGKLFRTKFSSNATPVFDLITLSNTNTFSKLVKVANTPLFVATAGTKLFRFSLNSTNNQVTETLLYANLVGTAKGLLAKMDTIKVTGVNISHLDQTSGGTFAYTNQTYQHQYNRLKSVRYDNVNAQWITCGGDGVMVRLENGNWVQKAHPVNANMNALKFTSNGLYAVGDAGYFSQLSTVYGSNSYTDAKMQLFLGAFVEGSVTQN